MKRLITCLMILLLFDLLALTVTNEYLSHIVSSWESEAYTKNPSSNFFDNKVVIVWGSTSDDEDELYINETMARDIVSFRIEKWLNEKDAIIKIIPDSLLTVYDMENYNLILVGSVSSNIVTNAVLDKTPFIINDNAVKIGNHLFEGDEVGISFKYINPANPEHLIWVISAPSYESLRFIPKEDDYCIFEVTDYSLNADRIKELVQGNFNENWKIEELKWIDNDEIYSGENDDFPVVPLKDYSFPHWAETGVMYEIFVRSFCDGNGDGNGDLKGLISKLDYLNDGDPDTHDDLGINLIWLMPIFESPSYHCYDVSDYYKIESDYGTNEDFQELLREAHKRGIKIITDLVINHCSNKHDFFQDAYGNPESKYSNWFFFTNNSQTRAHNWQFRHSEKDRALLDPFMPAWNINNTDVQEYLFNMAQYWIDPNQDGDFSDGIDGFRCDYVKGPSHEFWKNFRQSVKKINPEILLLAENWEGLDSISQSFDNQFDMAFDFPFQGSLAESITSQTAGELTNLINLQKKMLPENAVMNRFFNNHDMNRIFTQLDEESAKLGLTILLTMNNMPMLYYGDEIGMKGSKDPYDEGIRRPMEWCTDNNCEGMTNWYPVWDQESDGISVEEELDDSNSILNYVKNLIALRTANPAFAKGEITFLDVYNEFELIDYKIYQRAIAYTLSYKSETFLVLCNLFDETDLFLKQGNSIDLGEIYLSDRHEISYREGILKLKCPSKSSFIAKLLK